MSAIIANIKREPVRWLTGLQVVWIAVCGGLTVFNAWHPTADQLQWVLGVPIVIANALGFTIVREAVTPNEKLPDAVVDRARDRGLLTIEDVVVLAIFGVIVGTFVVVLAVSR